MKNHFATAQEIRKRRNHGGRPRYNYHHHGFLFGEVAVILFRLDDSKISVHCHQHQRVNRSNSQDCSCVALKLASQIVKGPLRCHQCRNI